MNNILDALKVQDKYQEFGPGILKLPLHDNVQSMLIVTKVIIRS